MSDHAILVETAAEQKKYKLLKNIMCCYEKYGRNKNDRKTILERA